MIFGRARELLAPATFFLVAVCYLPGVMSPSVAGRWAVLTVGAALLLFMVELRLSAATMFAAALVAWCCLGLAWSVSPLDTLGGIARLVPLLVIAVWASEQKDLRSVWVAYALGVSLSLPFAVAQRLGYHPVRDLAPMFYPVGGLFLTSNVLAEAAVLSAVAMIGLKRPILAAAPLASVVLAGRREAAMMLAAAALMWLWTVRPWREALAATAAVLVAVAACLWHFDHPFGDATRIEIWRDTLSSLSFFGSGLDTYASVFPAYVYPHSEPLSAVFELGVGSVVLFWIGAHALGSRQLPERAILAAGCASALVWFPLHDPATAAVAALVAGRLLGDRDRAERAGPVRGAIRVPGAASAVAGAVGNGGAAVSTGQEFADGAGGAGASDRDEGVAGREA